MSDRSSRQTQRVQGAQHHGITNLRDASSASGPTRFQVALLLAAAAATYGCGHPDGWMPMSEGKTWTYQATTETIRKTVTVKVSRQLTVAAAPGFEMESTLGASRQVWKGGTLYAETAANAQFSPPLPLLTPGVEIPKEKQKKVLHWEGTVTALGKDRQATGDLVEQNDSVELGTRKVPTILSIVTLHMPKGEIELKSWYQNGVGLVQQEQRTNGVRLMQLVLVGHT